MSNFRFNGFKKKNLMLLYRIIPEDFDEFDKIRNKKLSQCVLKLAISYNIEQKTLTDHNEYWMICVLMQYF